MVGIVPFRALAHRIVSENQAFNPGPVDDTGDLLESPHCQDKKVGCIWCMLTACTGFGFKRSLT